MKDSPSDFHANQDSWLYYSYYNDVLTLFAVDKFTIERVNKSGAVFDSTKLR